LIFIDCPFRLVVAVGRKKESMDFDVHRLLAAQKWHDKIAMDASEVRTAVAVTFFLMHPTAVRSTTLGYEILFRKL